MKFTQKSRIFWDSEDGEYTISKILVKDTNRFQYDAFHKQHNTIGGPFNNSTDAVRCCEDHQKKRAKA